MEEHLAASSHLSNISKRKEHRSKEQPRAAKKKAAQQRA
jgi:hypothetical protein